MVVNLKTLRKKKNTTSTCIWFSSSHFPRLKQQWLHEDKHLPVFPSHIKRSSHLWSANPRHSFTKEEGKNGNWDLLSLPSSGRGTVVKVGAGPFSGSRGHLPQWFSPTQALQKVIGAAVLPGHSHLYSTWSAASQHPPSTSLEGSSSSGHSLGQVVLFFHQFRALTKTLR